MRFSAGELAYAAIVLLTGAFAFLMVMGWLP